MVKDQQGNTIGAVYSMVRPKDKGRGGEGLLPQTQHLRGLSPTVDSLDRIPIRITTLPLMLPSRLSCFLKDPQAMAATTTPTTAITTKPPTTTLIPEEHSLLPTPTKVSGLTIIINTTTVSPLYLRTGLNLLVWAE